MRRVVHILVFLMLVNEGTAMNIYPRFMFAPFEWVNGVLFDPLLRTIRPFDVCMLLVLGYASLKQKSGARQLRPMRRSILVALGTILASFALGLARGGDGRAASWQVYLLLSSILLAFTLAAVLQTAEHYVALLYTVLAAGLYHAVMAIAFFVFYVRPGGVNLGALGDYLSLHDDTVLWTVGLVFIILRLFQFPTRRVRLLAAFAIPILLLAIQLNHRRLAWISLGGALVAMYFLTPMGVVKRRIRRIVTIAGPVLLLYAVIGWGRPEGFFRPLRAFESVSSAQDNSTKARNVENLGLIATANQGWLLGNGWGHKYIEISNKYQIHAFELWPYVPHNSVLGLFAYTGYLGFLGYWMMLPTAAFFHARTARYAPRAEDRFVGVVGMMQILICADQWYGDMGSFSAITDYTMATCLAAALRVPVGAGPSVWAEKKPAPPATGTPEAV